MNFLETLNKLLNDSGFAQSHWQNYVMIALAIVLIYLAIGRKFEPLLLLPIAIGMLVVNLPGGYSILYAPETETQPGGLFTYLYMGVDKVIFPPLIFLGIGAMTDFGPLIANPKSLILGAAAQIGIFITFIGALLLGFSGLAAAAISIIGGADGPTAIWLATMLNQGDLLPIIAIAAYSYMALIPAIQPPIMKLLTTKKERSIRMEQLRTVSKKEKIIFPILVICLCALILPQSLPLIGMLMFGNILKESTVTDRIAKTASNELINIITILLGLVVGSKAVGYIPGMEEGAGFLGFQTLQIVFLGLFAFIIGTACGVLMAKLLNVLSGGKINPLIGSAGVSAVPMAARISQKVGQEYVPDNYLLMHAMGPNVAGVIGSAVAAGVLYAMADGLSAIVGLF